METNEYEKQGETFLKKTKTSFYADFIVYGSYFDDDRKRGVKRDIYEITLTRRQEKMVFNFGQSIAKSGLSTNPVKTRPTAYDVLACLTKYDPGSFEDFCGNYGYDPDSRTAERAYKAVCKEWANVERLFADVLDDLREIN